MSENPPGKFSRPFAVEDLKARGATVHIEADAGERTALARRLGLLSIDSLSAGGTLGWTTDKALIRLEARLEAHVVQECVVTLEAVPAHIDARFSRLYEPERGDDDGERELDIPPDEEDPPESLAGDFLDVGEAVAEQLALELEPFPRAAGIAFDGYSSGPTGDDGPGDRENPFAVLAQLEEKEE